jgi:hypothetical protein
MLKKKFLLSLIIFQGVLIVIAIIAIIIGVFYKYDNGKNLKDISLTDLHIDDISLLDEEHYQYKIIEENKIIFQNKFKNRELEKNYLAFSYGVLDQNFIQIDKNISRQKFQRTKFDTTETGGKNALTYVENQKIFYGSISKLNCQIITGRTHQIRVHLLSLGLPIIGDKQYQLNKEQKFRLANLPNNVRETVTSFPRQALHSHKLSFIHPKSLKEVKITCDMPNDMKDLEQNLL